MALDLVFVVQAPSVYTLRARKGWTVGRRHLRCCWSARPVGIVASCGLPQSGKACGGFDRTSHRHRRGSHGLFRWRIPDQRPRLHVSDDFLAVSLWIAFGIFFLAEACRPLPSISLFGIPSTRLIAVPLLLMLAFTYYRTQSYWIEATGQLDQVLRRAPVEKLMTIPAGHLSFISGHRQTEDCISWATTSLALAWRCITESWQGLASFSRRQARPTQERSHGLAALGRKWRTNVFIGTGNDLNTLSRAIGILPRPCRVFSFGALTMAT